MNFEKWNSRGDLKGLREDVKSAKEDSSNKEYEKVPYGKYEVKITKLKLKESKKGDPMVSWWL